MGTDAVSKVGAPSPPPIVIQDVEMADIPTTDASTNFNGSAPEVPKAGKQPWAVRMLKRKARLARIAQIVSWTEETDNVAAEELMQKVRTNGMQVTAMEPITFATAVPWSRAEDATHGKEDTKGMRGVTIQMAMQQAIDGFEREAENCLQLLHIQGVLLEALDM